MKKILTIAALACLLALSTALVGCGGSSGSSAAAGSAASATVKINVEGMGQIAWAYEGQEIEWDDNRPYQSAMINDTIGQTISIAAKSDPQADDNFKFVKWTRDGADFSTDKEIKVLIDRDAEYVAVFESNNA